MSDPDRIDLKILDLLQRNGRMSVTEVGEQVGLSTSPCSERIKRLERQKEKHHEQVYDLNQKIEGYKKIIYKNEGTK